MEVKGSGQSFVTPSNAEMCLAATVKTYGQPAGIFQVKIFTDTQLLD